MILFGRDYLIKNMLTELPLSFPGRIFRSPMPFSTYDKSIAWESYLEQDVNLVVILTEQQEYRVYTLRDLPKFYRSNGLDVLHIPVPDFGVPTDPIKWEEGINAVIDAAGEGKNVVVHCLAGKGRTGMFLACLAKTTLGLSGDQAINWVRESIPGALENYDQEEYVINY